MGMFDSDLVENNSPVDKTQITTTILYYSTEELKLFRTLAKRGIKQMYPNNFKEKGNIADFLLTILKEKYEDVST